MNIVENELLHMYMGIIKRGDWDRVAGIFTIWNAMNVVIWENCLKSALLIFAKERQTQEGPRENKEKLSLLQQHLLFKHGG